MTASSHQLEQGLCCPADPLTSPRLLLEELPQHTLGVSLGLLGAQERGGHPSTWQLAQRHDLHISRGKFGKQWQHCQSDSTLQCHQANDACTSCSVLATAGVCLVRSDKLDLGAGRCSSAPTQQACRKRQRCF